MGDSDVKSEVRKLVESGTPPETIAGEINYQKLLSDLDYLLEESEDPTHVAKQLSSSDIIEKLDTLAKYEVDIDQLVEDKNCIKGYDINEHAIDLLNHNANADKVADRLSQKGIVKHLQPLLEHNATPALLLKRMDPEDVDRNKDILINYANANQLCEEMTYEQVYKNREFLKKHHVVNIRKYY